MIEALKKLFLLNIAGASIFSGCTSVPNKQTQCHSLPSESTEKILVNTNDVGVAVEGYDVVAYFKDSKPTPGNPDIRASYKHATYLFASEEHRKLFEKHPEKYVPQFGGFCAYAASIHKISPIDPEHWSIQEGRLLLQHNDRAQDLWNEDKDGNLKQADRNWPSLVSEHGDKVKILVNTDEHGLAVDGYDVVAFFTEKKPVKGFYRFKSHYKTAHYWFASEEHKKLFDADPEKYVPLYGGFCGYAAAINKVSVINVEYFVITDNKLVLNHTQEAKNLWNEDPQKSKAIADANWPGLSRAACKEE